MIMINDKTKCTGCHACFLSCPKHCISMVADAEGFWYPKVDNTKCSNCNICNNVCPIINNSNVNEAVNIQAFAAISNNDGIRMQSSSGGIFSALAEMVLDEGGVVFGAAFDEDFSVKTTYVENKEKLNILRGSKYVQSMIGNSYVQAKKFLNDGRVVLFSGTPCQIGGLYAFLNKNYERLVTVDIICHGVPSPLVWRKYLDYRMENSKAKIKHISFRNKNEGWKNFSMYMQFLDGKEYCVRHDNDPFMDVFLRNFCLRPSCYECSYKTANRQADITLADFWGIEDVHKDLFDDKGTSLVILNSNVGKDYFNHLSENLQYEYFDYKRIQNYNACYLKSVNKPDERDYFLKQIAKYGFRHSYDKLIIKEEKLLVKQRRIRRYKKRIKAVKRRVLSLVKRN